MLAAFLTGLVGSLHCLGMCGPIALALPGTERQGWRYLLGRLLYNVGRLLTYSMLGGIVALLGVAAAMFEMQRWFSLALGAILILIALKHYGVFGKRAQSSDNFLNRAWRRGMGKIMQIRGLGGLFALGLMNGILPCGLVYAGLFLAANSTYAWEGMAKMALFGLGTLPLMLSLSWSGKWLTGWLRNKSRFVMPVVMTFMGTLFLLRGMALGIPYLSPKMEAGSEPGKVKMSCCEKIEGGKASSRAKSSTDYTAPETPTEKTP
ncbi:MAG: sulfite exporter TauE/SafE family protein [Bacteroidetes bacterium]|nr:sulfite exporter TauE/SafE family protein [Bacteroidota bacterium]MBL0018584.1 sulfite exporter TauE/SafE family protein [Bacteroidota bacterium]MBP6638839.1 sulfite exporter TauE/SafE family protein [Bacteroidia bacterium]MBP6720898.1 sulfite exporter TauE/SafE family protein [Bacteroidia bacterium]MBP8073370.1 sulfite exporter TauE/SafE family protein [Bacteroidia bacterium]